MEHEFRKVSSDFSEADMYRCKKCGVSKVFEYVADQGIGKMYYLTVDGERSEADLSCRGDAP